MIGKLAPPKNPAKAGSTSSILSVALRKKYLMIIKPKKITKPFNQYLWDFFSTNLVIKYTTVTNATNKIKLLVLFNI